MKLISINILLALSFLVLHTGCNENATEPYSKAPSLTNEPIAKFPVKIIYDHSTGQFSGGYFARWTSGEKESSCAFFIRPGSRTWEEAENDNPQTVNWWNNLSGLFVGSVPGGIIFNGFYRQVYSSRNAIGILTASGNAPNLTWTDMGLPVATWSEDRPKNGLLEDASLMVDFDTRLWLVHGKGRIFIVELNPATLRLMENPEKTAFKDDGRWICIADGGRPSERPSCEGAFIFPHEFNGTKYYYLFVTWGKVKTEVMVGRATSPTGPYLDKKGISMNLENGINPGGSLLLDDGGAILGNTRYRKPLYPGVCEYPVKDGKTKYVFSFQFRPYADLAERLAAKQMYFDEDGWPVVTVNDFDPTEAVPIK